MTSDVLPLLEKILPVLHRASDWSALLSSRSSPTASLVIPMIRDMKGAFAYMMTVFPAGSQELQAVREISESFDSNFAADWEDVDYLKYATALDPRVNWQFVETRSWLDDMYTFANENVSGWLVEPDVGVVAGAGAGAAPQLLQGPAWAVPAAAEGVESPWLQETAILLREFVAAFNSYKGDGLLSLSVRRMPHARTEQPALLPPTPLPPPGHGLLVQARPHGPTHGPRRAAPLQHPRERRVRGEHLQLHGHDQQPPAQSVVGAPTDAHVPQPVDARLA